MDFWKIDHPFAIGEGRYAPLPSFIVPTRVVNDMFELIWTHENIHDGSELFDLLFLISDGIKQLLLLVFMLILNILQFNQIHSVLLLDLLKTLAHLVNLFIEIFVVFLNME